MILKINSGIGTFFTKKAEKRAGTLFGQEVIDRAELLPMEAVVLDDSIQEKYVPSLARSLRARFEGFFVGALIPYEVFIGIAVILAASATATTGAWYSITLKEMKAKFENMGLQLTSKLLGSDMTANSFVSYVGIGFAYRFLLFESWMQTFNNPSPEEVAKSFAETLAAFLIHYKIENVLSNKEDASVQYDYNDATLAGMTEQQQVFYKRSTNAIQQAVQSLRNGHDKHTANRSIFDAAAATLEFLNGCQIDDVKTFEDRPESDRPIDEIVTPNAHYVSRQLSHFGDSVMPDFEDSYDGDAKKFTEFAQNFFTMCYKANPTKLNKLLGKINALKTQVEYDQDRTNNIIADGFSVLIRAIEEHDVKLLV